MARGVIDGSGAQATLITATVGLFLFAAIGYVVGRIADSIVFEAVKIKFDEELKAREEAIENS